MTDRTGLRARHPHIPQRTCVGCRRTDSREVLLRVVVVEQGEGSPLLTVDPARRLAGRGAWLHPDSGCLEQAVRRKAFTRALRASTGLDAAPVADHLAALAGSTTSVTDGSG